MKKRFIVALILFQVLISQEKIEKLNFLSGTWKVEGKEKYESWSLKNGSITANIYKIKNTEKIITEEAKIELNRNSIEYLATVKNQNQGKTIPFKLVSDKSDRFIFENKNHDFPNKIVYEKKSDSRLFIQVLNNEDKGFSYYMNKQSEHTEKIRSLILDMFKAFNDHDWKKHVSYSAPNAQIRNPDSKMKFHNPSHEEQEKKYASFTEWCPDIQDSITSITINENTAVVEFIANGTLKDGNKFKLPICTVLKFKNYKIISESTYYSE